MEWKVPHKRYGLKFTRLHRLEKSQRENWEKIIAIMDSMKIPSENIYFRYGFEVLGPLLFGFSKWLHETAAMQKIDHLYFLSRDGYLLLNTYNSLYPHDKITASYFYISRKVARQAQLWLKPDLCEVVGLFPAYVNLKRDEFSAYFNVEDEESLRCWNDCDLPEKMRFLPGDLLTDQRLISFYHKIKPRMIEESKKIYVKMMQYLAQNRFNERVGIVDIGWNGTIQNCLETIMRSSPDCNYEEVVGFYLGLTQKAVQTKNKFSFIAAEEKPYEFAAGLVEYPFLAPEGSLLGYSAGSDGSITTELSNCEYDKEELEIVKNMQAGVLHFINYAKDFPLEEFTWDAPFSYANLKRLSKHPTFQEVITFGDLAYYDGEKRQIAAPRSFTHYLLHPKDFPYDLSVSGWRIGFLKRFLKVGLDYNKLLKLYKNAHGS